VRLFHPLILHKHNHLASLNLVLLHLLELAHLHLALVALLSQILLKVKCLVKVLPEQIHHKLKVCLALRLELKEQIWHRPHNQPVLRTHQLL
jgi:hypothetical protein